MGYVYYYKNVREHSALDYRTPFEEHGKAPRGAWSSLAGR